MALIGSFPWPPPFGRGQGGMSDPGRKGSPLPAAIIPRMMRLRLVALPLMVILALAAAGCSNDNDGGGTSPATSSGCDEVNALKDSLTSLTRVDPVRDGTDALESAAADVNADLDAALSAVGADLEPAVDQVKTAFGDLESALNGVSSAGSLGAAATEVGNALSELGTALDGLRSDINQIC